MRVVERTPDRLVLRLGTMLNAATCTFDRATNTAEIRRTVLLWPRRTVRLALSDVVTANVVRQESSVSDAGQVIHYPELQLRSGATLPLTGFGKSSAEQAAECIRRFLDRGAGPDGDA